MFSCGVSGAESRFRFGQYENNIISRFIGETGLASAYREYSSVTPKATASAPWQSGRKDFAASFGVSAANKNQIIDKDLSAYALGTKVSHSRYGEGVIVELDGENAKIEFSGLGVKQFNLSLAPLEVCGERD